MTTSLLAELRELPTLQDMRDLVLLPADAMTHVTNLEHGIRGRDERIATLLAALEQQEWIPVGERLPEPGGAAVTLPASPVPATSSP